MTTVRPKGDPSPDHVGTKRNLLGRLVQVGDLRVIGRASRRGHVLLARPRSDPNGQTVVLKRFHSRHRTKQHAEREAELHTRCHDHPNVCACLGVLRCRADTFIVLQFAEHGNLRDLVSCQTIKRLSVEASRVIMHQLAQAVRHLHLVCGVAHCDVKPQNVLVLDAAGPRVALCDFGLAMPCESDEEMVVATQGTLGCTPPEMLLADSQRHPPRFSPRRADVFGLGCIFFFLLTGHLPFEGSTKYHIALRTVGEQFSVQLAALPTDCEELLFAMLDPDPGARPKIDEVVAHAFFEGVGDLSA